MERAHATSVWAPPLLLLPPPPPPLMTMTADAFAAFWLPTPTSAYQHPCCHRPVLLPPHR